jgi:hypothetical protein
MEPAYFLLLFFCGSYADLNNSTWTNFHQLYRSYKNNGLDSFSAGKDPLLRLKRCASADVLFEGSTCPYNLEANQSQSSEGSFQFDRDSLCDLQIRQRVMLEIIKSGLNTTLNPSPVTSRKEKLKKSQEIISLLPSQIVCSSRILTKIPVLTVEDLLAITTRGNESQLQQLTKFVNREELSDISASSSDDDSSNPLQLVREYPPTSLYCLTEGLSDEGAMLYGDLNFLVQYHGSLSVVDKEIEDLGNLHLEGVLGVHGYQIQIPVVPCENFHQIISGKKNLSSFLRDLECYFEVEDRFLCHPSLQGLHLSDHHSELTLSRSLLLSSQQNFLKELLSSSITSAAAALEVVSVLHDLGLNPATVPIEISPNPLHESPYLSALEYSALVGNSNFLPIVLSYQSIHSERTPPPPSSSYYRYDPTNRLEMNPTLLMEKVSKKTQIQLDAASEKKEILILGVTSFISSLTAGDIFDSAEIKELMPSTRLSSFLTQPLRNYFKQILFLGAACQKLLTCPFSWREICDLASSVPLTGNCSNQTPSPQTLDAREIFRVLNITTEATFLHLLDKIIGNPIHSCEAIAQRFQNDIFLKDIVPPSPLLTDPTLTDDSERKIKDEQKSRSQLCLSHFSIWRSFISSLSFLFSHSGYQFLVWCQVMKKMCLLEDGLLNQPYSSVHPWVNQSTERMREFQSYGPKAEEKNDSSIPSVTRIAELLSDEWMNSADHILHQELQTQEQDQHAKMIQSTVKRNLKYLSESSETNILNSNLNERIKSGVWFNSITMPLLCLKSDDLYSAIVYQSPHSVHTMLSLYSPDYQRAYHSTTTSLTHHFAALVQENATFLQQHFLHPNELQKKLLFFSECLISRLLGADDVIIANKSSHDLRGTYLATPHQVRDPPNHSASDLLQFNSEYIEAVLVQCEAALSFLINCLEGMVSEYLREGWSQINSDSTLAREIPPNRLPMSNCLSIRFHLRHQIRVNKHLLVFVQGCKNWVCAKKPLIAPQDIRSTTLDEIKMSTRSVWNSLYLALKSNNCQNISSLISFLRMRSVFEPTPHESLNCTLLWREAMVVGNLEVIQLLISFLPTPLPVGELQPMKCHSQWSLMHCLLLACHKEDEAFTRLMIAPQGSRSDFNHSLKDREGRNRDKVVDFLLSLSGNQISFFFLSIDSGQMSSPSTLYPFSAVDLLAMRGKWCHVEKLVLLLGLSKATGAISRLPRSMESRLCTSPLLHCAMLEARSSILGVFRVHSPN